MIRFRDIMYEILVEESAELIKEGGNAIAGVDRIELKNIEPTVKQIIDQYINPVFPDSVLGKNVFLLGSTGKKESSGDLDLGFDLLFEEELSDVSIESAVGQLYDYIKTTSKSEVKINEFTHDMVHFDFPQYDKDGNLIGKTVQVDVLFTLTPDFCKFYMYSPSQNESSYKGAHRNDLLRAIAKVISFQVLKQDDNDNLLTWIQFDIGSNGLFNCVKTIVDEDGNHLKWGDTDEDLEIGYAVDLHKRVISTDPKEVIHFLVGNYSINDINTFEKLLNIIENDDNFKYKFIKDKILVEAAKLMKENTRIEFPSEMEKYV